MTFGSDVNISTGRECSGTIFPLAVTMPQIHCSMYDVLSDSSTAGFPTILSHVHMCRSHKYTCMSMRPCKGTAWLVAVLSGGALTGLPCENLFCGRKELTVDEVQAGAHVQ